MVIVIIIYAHLFSALESMAASLYFSARGHNCLYFVCYPVDKSLSMHPIERILLHLGDTLGWDPHDQGSSHTKGILSDGIHSIEWILASKPIRSSGSKPPSGSSTRGYRNIIIYTKGIFSKRIYST